MTGRSPRRSARSGRQCRSACAGRRPRATSACARVRRRRAHCAGLPEGGDRAALPHTRFRHDPRRARPQGRDADASLAGVQGPPPRRLPVHSIAPTGRFATARSNGCTSALGRRVYDPATEGPLQDSHPAYGRPCRVVAALVLENRVAATQIGAAVVTTFMLGGSRVGVCDFPATQASIMSAHSCSMWRRCSPYSALL